MTFFYDLNKRMAELATKQNLAEGKQAKPDFLDIDKDGDRKEPMKKAAKEKDLDEASYSATSARAGKDIGKPGKAFGTIAKDAAGRYGSKEAGERVAGAVLKKLRAKEDVSEAEMDESALQAYLGKKKYGEQGMKALQQAGRDGASKQKMASIRAKHNKMDEAEMEEGNEFSGELVKARAQGAKEFEVDGKTYPVKEAKAKKDKPKNVFDPEVARKMFEPEKGTGKFDKKQISTGTVYTRRYEEEPDEDEDSDTPKKKGRKTVGAGKGKKLGAKSRGTSKLASKGSIAEDSTMNLVVRATGYAADLINRMQQNGQVEPKELMTKLRAIHKILSQVQGGNAVTISEDDTIPLVDKGEYDREGEMAKQQIHTIMRAAKQLHGMLGDDDNLPEWVQKKITLAQNYIDGVSDYMTSVDAERDEEQPIAEKAVSQAQRKAAGIAYAAAKGEIPKSELRGASKEMAKMPAGELKKFATTKEKDLPKKVKEADAEPKAKKTGGIEFGKGVYESINSRVENMIAEGMNVSVNMSMGSDGEPTKNITVSAEGAEAETLAQLLNLAGMKSSSCGCGQTPCGCDKVEEAYGNTDPTENAPDYPTDAETTGEDDALLRRWAGGLNKPKSTGQTTIPVIASQTDRQVSEQAVADKLGMNLYAELKQFKAR